MANINELLDGHVTLEVECLDRLYLNGYVEELVVGGQLRRYLKEQLGKPYPSPPLLGQITQDFVRRLKGYAQQRQIPIIEFKHGERKDDIANRIRQQRKVRDEVVFIGVAQEKAMAFSGHKVDGQFEFKRDKPVYVNHYYCYLDDED